MEHHRSHLQLGQTIASCNDLFDTASNPSLCHQSNDDVTIAADDAQNLASLGTKWKAEARSSWLTLLKVVPYYVVMGAQVVAFGFFYVEYCSEFNASKSTVGFIYALQIGTELLCGVVTSALLETFGSRPIALVGGAFMSVAALTASIAPNVVVLCLTDGVLMGISRSMGTMACSVLLQKHFSRNRTIAQGIGMLGLSLGNLIGPLLTHKLIQSYGWRGAQLVLSAIYANTLVMALTFHEPVDEAFDRNVDDNGDNSSKSKNVMTCRETRNYYEQKSISEPLLSKNCNEHQRNSSYPLGSAENNQQQEISDSLRDENAPIKLEDETTENNGNLQEETCNTLISRPISSLDEATNGQTDVENCPYNLEEKSRDILPSKEKLSEVKEEGNNLLNTSVSPAKWRQLVVAFCDFSLFKDFTFDLMAVATFCFRFFLLSFLQHIPSRALTLGLSKGEAALLMSIFSLANFSSRALTTVIANVQGVNRIVYFGVGEMFGVLASVILVLFHSYWGHVAALVTFGLFIGCTNTILYVVFVDLFGVENLSRTVGLASMAGFLAPFTSTPLMGWLYDVTGDYDLPYVIIGCIIAMGSLLTFVVAGVHHRNKKRGLVAKVTEVITVTTFADEKKNSKGT